MKAIKSHMKSFYALAITALVGVAPIAHGAQTYDFSSSTSEASAFVSSLTASAFTLILSALAVLLALALTLMGIAWVWGRFKKFSGIGKKI